MESFSIEFRKRNLNNISESVSAINPKTVEVTFNQAVAASDAEGTTSPSNTANLSKYSVGVQNPTAVKLSADGKTATLTFANSVEGKNLAVVVEPITSKADDNVKTKRYAEVMSYTDTVKPTVSKIESVTGGDQATSVKLTFSEPVDSLDAIKIDGVALTGGGTNYTLAPGDTGLVLSGLNLDATKNHTLEIVNLKDTATNPNVTSYIQQTFKPVVDTVAPTVTDVAAKSDTALVFTFSKPVDLDGKDANNYVKLFDEDLTDQTTALLVDSGTPNTFSEVADSNGTKFEVDLAATPFSGNEKTKQLTAQIQDKVITDLQGNKVAKTTKNVTINKDVTAPSLTNASYRTDNDGKVKELSFTFDEDVTLTTSTALTDLLADKSVNVENSVADDLKAVFGGTLPVGTFTVKDNKITFALTTAQNVSGKYNLEVAANKVKDKSLATNANKVQKFTLDFGAAKADETFKVDSGNTSATGNVITVTFDEAVKGGTGSGSATLLSAYKLNGKALPEGTTITLDSAQTEATITLPEGSIKDSDSAAIFVADSIVSKDGKKNLEKYTGTISIDDNVAPEVTDVKLTSDNDLLVTFSEPVTNQTLADFDIVINGTTVASPNESDGSTPITLSLTAGTGSDVGKYIINLSDLVEFDGNDTVINLTAAGSDIVVANSDVTSTFKYATSTAIDSIVVKVKDGTRTTDDAAGNTLTPGTEKKVK